MNLAAAAAAVAETAKDTKGLGLKDEVGIKVGMQEQAAIALADVAYKNHEMQDAIIEAGGVPPLLQFIRTGSQLGQEHAGRAIWHLAESSETHEPLIRAGGSPSWRCSRRARPRRRRWPPPASPTSPTAASSSGRSARRRGPPPDGRRQSVGTRTRQTRSVAHPPPRRAARRGGGSSSGGDGGSSSGGGGGLGESQPAADGEVETELESDRLVAIADAGGIMPLVTLLSSGTTQAREFAACALWHLGLDRANQSAIARFNGIAPLVTILDDGTETAHKHAADALARLAINNADNQAQIAKHCVALLGNQSTGAAARGAGAPRPRRGEPGLAGRHRQRGRHLAARQPPLVGRARGQGPGRRRSTLSFNSPSTSSRSRRASSCSSARARRRRRST